MAARTVGRPIEGPDEARLWSLIEAAWASLGAKVNRVRRSLSARPPAQPVDDLPLLKQALETFTDGLARQCRELTAEDLAVLDLVVERKLYDIDSAELHAIVDGSDDGFLYARGFIVAMGREFYYAVAADVLMAVPGMELEEMCYFFAHRHHDRYGVFPGADTGISRESGSNPAGWTG
ncbi:MAG TPA: hypothetical protein VHW06_22120 [Streptosporangiaceae bacterium]|jgi:hypothetical protein|nr:hypothetical protein [Streptosporangiaceae bacterium]